ncbi:hypothetical protein N9X61_01705 [Sulfurimonas sp.]|nr:hypothetical protein [Sulfurimonas sp.]
MKKFSLATLLAGAMLFVTMGVTSLNAEAMKCGAGKCGSSMGADMKKPACCKTPAGELKKSAVAGECKCPPQVACTCKNTDKCTCGAAAANTCKCPAQVACTCKDASNCTCPAGKKAPKAAMKCGTGKCG